MVAAILCIVHMLAKRTMTPLEKDLQDFLAQYSESLQALMSDLDEARISHYSSGCGTKKVTFDIFPASAYVAEMLGLLSLNRPHITKARWGFKDASSKNTGNPAHDFIQYLRRWSLFAEQVMKTEGDASRGVAAARAKLTMADLIQRLTQDAAPVRKVNVKAPQRTGSFLRLMQEIGLTLESREKNSLDKKKTDTQKTGQRNYLKALAAAQGSNPGDLIDQTQAA